MDFVLVDTPLLTHFMEISCPVYISLKDKIKPVLKPNVGLLEINNKQNLKIYLNKKNVNKIKDDVKERLKFNPLLALKDESSDLDGFNTYFKSRFVDDQVLNILKEDYKRILNFLNINLKLSSEYNRLRYYSHFQFCHSITLHYMFKIVADKSSWSENLRGLFYFAAYIHDIGMADVLIEEKQIDDQPESYDDDIVEQIIIHCEEGIRLMDQKVTLPSILYEIILNHHEDINGDGYPRGVKLENFVCEVQFFAIVHRWLVKAVNMSLGSELEPYHFVNTWNDKWEKLKCEPYLSILYKHFSLNTD